MLAMLCCNKKKKPKLLPGFKTPKEENRTDVLVELENASRCFPVPGYLARQVSDASCHDLARLYKAPFYFGLIILHTRRLLQDQG